MGLTGIVAKPSKRDPGERARQLVAAAHDLLDEEGLEGLTIQAVLERTGLARRAFYDCFAGKDDLVLAVFEQSLRTAAARFAEQSAGGDPMAALRNIVTGIVLGRGDAASDADGHVGRRGAALSREHLRLAEARPADLQRAIRPLIEVIAALLAQAMEQGQVRKGAPDRLAMLVYNLVSTTTHTELLAAESGGPGHDRRLQLAEDIWQFCRRALEA